MDALIQLLGDDAVNELEAVGFVDFLNSVSDSAYPINELMEIFIALFKTEDEEVVAALRVLGVTKGIDESFIDFAAQFVRHPVLMEMWIGIFKGIMSGKEEDMFDY